MKSGIILLAITVVLIAFCGCTQTAPPVQPTTTVTIPLQTTQPLIVTTIPVSQTTPSVSGNTIRIKNFAFDPANITVKVGSTVRWENKDSVPHRIQFTDTNFSPFLLASSQSGSQKFDQAGVFDYVCSIHPDMHGTVIVER